MSVQTAIDSHFHHVSRSRLLAPQQAGLSFLQHFPAWGPGLWQGLPTTYAVQIDKQPIKTNN